MRLSGSPALRQVVWTIALSIALSGCTGIKQYVQQGFKVGPDYFSPSAPVSDDWLDSGNPRLSTDPLNYADWWSVFQDPALEQLITLAVQQNISLREAGLRIAEVQAQRAVVTGLMFPQSQELFGEFNRTQRSTATATFPRGGSGGFGTLALKNFSNWRFGGSLAWELDFWGRFRRAVEAADARLDGSVENYDDALVLLIAEVAATYIEVRTLDQRLEFAHNNVALQQESARIAEVRRQAAAVDSEIDAPQSRSNLARTQAAIESLQIARRQAENRLSVLLGMPPHDLTYLLTGPSTIPKAPEQISLSMPGELLRRRPDVRRAERELAARSAEIGVLVSELYPGISLNGTLFLDAAQFPLLFGPRAWAGTVGPSFRWNLLNYGRVVNSIRAQDSRFQQQVATFQQTVLRANEEVENAVIAFLRYHDQIELLEVSVREAQEAVRVSQARYQAGQIDFNRLFTLEELLVVQQDQLASSRGDLATSLVQVYKALGGGWEIRLGSLVNEPAAEMILPGNSDAPFE